ncbi:MAG: hypothetical protein D3910_02870 [Candidatus Electrothrix sp. ATG2]|nr:hypothetical protein [Candidatus Electrothrix sp. ATG2]
MTLFFFVKEDPTVRLYGLQLHSRCRDCLDKRTSQQTGKPISFDWAMKTILRREENFDILEGFLSELLKDDIRIEGILKSEGNQEEQQDKFNRVDLKVKNRKDESMIIEVLYDHELDFLQRILFGTSKILAEHLQKGDPYSAVDKVISVNILYFDLDEGTDHVYHGTTSFLGIHNQDLLRLSKKQQALYQKWEAQKWEPHKIIPEYYFIKVNRFNDIAKDGFKNGLDEWIYFL